MNMNKLSLAAVLFASAFTVQAAQQIDFNIEANIPGNDFYVTAVNGWDSQVQKMSWDEVKSGLSDIRQQLTMKNTGGGIKAYLASKPILSGNQSTDTIDLTVSVAGQELPVSAASAKTLYSADEAKTEKTATMTVSADTTTRPGAGNYIGAITMMFESEEPEG
ncbi:fimbrial assembly protein [Citrobacter braakii]|nr:fimbrial assembly protein [Citrobacter braakii]